MNNSPSTDTRGYSIALPNEKPIFTYIILGITVVIFLLQLASESLTGDDLLFYFGGKINQFIIAGEYWRLFTPIFLHADLTHLGSNMLSLAIFGSRVESLFGHRRFLLIYFIAGIAGTVASFIFSINPSLGASGAIFGIIGAFTLYLYTNRQNFGGRGSAYFRDMLILIGINLFVSFRPGIDLWGHIGGLIGGAILGLVIAPHWRVELDPITGMPTLGDDHSLNLTRWLASFAILFVLFLITFSISLLRA